MSDFIKAKIGFAVALLIALFTIHPVLIASAKSTFTVFSVQVKFVWPYYVVVGFFSLSVYIYALAFLANRDESWQERLGNWLYATALLTPVLCVGVWCLSTITSIILPVISLSFWGGIVSGIASGLIVAFTSYRISKRLNRRDRESKAEMLDREEGFHFERAASTLRAGYSSFAIIQTFQAIELALRRALLVREIPTRSRTTGEIINAAIKAGIIPFAARDDLEALRQLRNRAAHEAESIHQDEARAALEKAQAILAMINRRGEDEREVA